ncbi:hypothetical protein Hdeb2414_s0006g00197891 [Helianthus debilis subsp. tardiflorus]
MIGSRISSALNLLTRRRVDRSAFRQILHQPWTVEMVGLTRNVQPHMPSMLWMTREFHT